MIELSNVSKTVMSGTHPLTIIHSLDLVIASGAFWSITGPSGSGKSTLLGLIAGLDAPTTGTISVSGHDLSQMSEDGLAELRRDEIGYVFQFFHLIPTLTAFENVLVPMELSGKVDSEQRAEGLLTELGLGERMEHYPSQLSGGEQQRVALARALANDPAILLADEPTGNLDEESANQIAELLVSIHQARGTTVLLATHDPDLAGRAQTQLRLRGGRVHRIDERDSKSAAVAMRGVGP